MKAIIFCLAVIGSFVHAETRCMTEVSAAVSQQAERDFPGKNFVVTMPDLNNTDEVTVNMYLVDIINMDNVSVLGRYNVMVGETCQVLSGPTLSN